jgi:hypothetical protein
MTGLIRSENSQPVSACSYVSVEQQRAAVMAVERRYRFAAALGRAACYTSPGYTALVNLASYFRDKPSEARDFAEFHLRELPSSAAQQAAAAAFVVEILRGVEHDAPQHQIDALAEYARAVAEAASDEH